MRLLGGFEGWLPDGRRVELTARKLQALLAFLALPPGAAHLRDALAALLWGDASDTQARTSLRQALSKLRALVGPDLLQTEGETVRLDARHVEVDVGSFEEEVAAGNLEALKRAFAVYRGDLLAGLRVTSPAFEEWLLPERERLRELAQEALARLFTLQRDGGALEAAVQTGLRLLALDPTQEPVHRALMRLYLRLGRRGRALRQYQECLSVLQRELRVDPEPETRQLYQQILRQSPIHAVRDLDRSVSTTPLVGRQAEMERLKKALGKAWAGHGQVVAVLGEAGIGKTRLVEEVMDETAQRGGTPLIGHGHETTGNLAFGPWVEALRHEVLIGEGGVASDIDPGSRVELGRLFPQLGTPAHDFSTAPENVLRLFEAVFQLLRRAGERGPITLVLEDLHWADELTVQLLGFLARRVASNAVLLVATSREEDLPAAPGLQRLLHELDQQHRLMSLRLGALSSAETSALVRKLTSAPSDAGRELEAQIWAFSRGNPFMVQEAIRVAHEATVIETSQALALPDRVRAMIAGRLERLSPRARDLVALSAVIGREIPFPLLQRASGLTEDEAATGLEELVRRRVLGAVGERFEFTHDRIQEVAYAGLLAPRLRVLHAAVGQALEELNAGRLEAVTDRLAYHYARTTIHDKAVEYLRRFAEQAAQRYAHVEAVTALREALGHVERLPAAARNRRLIDLLIPLAQSLFVLVRPQEIVNCLLPFRDDVERLTDPRMKAAYNLWLGHGYAMLFDQAEARAVAERVLDAARLSDDAVTAGQAYVLLAWIAWSAGHPTTGIRLATDAIAFLGHRADPQYWLGAPFWLSMACWALGANHSVRGEFGPALEALARSEGTAQAIGHRLLQAVDRWFRVEIHARRGDWERAVSEGRVALEELPNPSEAPLFVSAVLGWALCEQGRVGEAIAVLELHVGRLRTMGERPMLANTLVLLGGAYLRGGRLEDARRTAAEGLEMASSVNYRHVVGLGQQTLGRVALAACELDASEGQLTKALDTFAAMPAPLEVALIQLDLAELAAARGDGATAERQLHAAYEALRTLDAPRRLREAVQLGRKLGFPLV